MKQKGTFLKKLFQFSRSLVGGGIATLFDLLLFLAIASWTPLPYQGAVSIGFLGGLFLNYILHHTWVFSRSACSPLEHFRDFVHFGIVGLSGLGLTLLLMVLFHEIMGLPLILSRLLSLVVFFWNFWARKVFIFDRKRG